MDKENTAFLFVSYAQADTEQVVRVKADFLAYGFSCCMQQEASYLGRVDGLEGLSTTIRASSALLLIATPESRSTHAVHEALRLATLYQRPVYALWISGESWREVLPVGWENVVKMDARGEHYPHAFQKLLHELRSFKTPFWASPETIPPLPVALPTPRNPYKSLRAFQQEDARDFFGRDQWIDHLAEALHQILLAAQQGQPTPRLFAVIGSSGSGKSSAMLAGLLPQLRQGRLPQSDTWIYLKPMVPGSHPLEALAGVFCDHVPASSVATLCQNLEDVHGLHRVIMLLCAHKDTEALADGWHNDQPIASISRNKDTEELQDVRGFPHLSAAAMQGTGPTVLLFIDQFEELFTQTQSEEERRHFLDLLLTAVKAPQGPLLVLLTMRADCYDHPLRYPELGKLLEAQHLALLPMTQQELRAVIEKPAQLPEVGLHFENDLVEELLGDQQGQTGALPLLQFTLTQLFARREGSHLTHRAYQEIGGVRDALGNHAESTYLSLPSDTHRHWARTLFLLLIDVGTITQKATSRRIAFSDLPLIEPAETAVLETVWKTFEEQGLLTCRTITSSSTLEVSHEVLLEAWERLRTWMQETPKHLSPPRLSLSAGKEYKARGKQEGAWTGDKQLALAHLWRAHQRQSDGEKVVHQAQVSAHHTDPDSTMRRRVLVSLAVLGLTGGVISLSRHVPLQEAPSLPSTRPSRPARPLVYSRHTGSVLSVAWSPDGRRLASASFDQTVQVWEARTGRWLQTYRGHQGTVWCVAWSPDGAYLASASDDQTVQIWEARSGKLFQTYRGHRSTVWSVAWSPDGRRLASASFDQTVQVWEAESGRQIRTYRGHRSTVNSVAWSPDGGHLVSGGDDQTVQIWEAESGRRIQTYRGPKGFIESVAWSPDGTRIASGGNDRTVQVWEAESGRLRLAYQGHQSTVNSVAWSPNGLRIASASTRQVQVWEAESGRLLQNYTGHHGFVVYCVAWSPDSTHLASASFDESVQVWAG